MDLEKRGFKELTKGVLEKLPMGDYAIVSEINEHLGFGTLSVDTDEFYRWHTFDATNADAIKLDSPVVHKNDDQIL